MTGKSGGIWIVGLCLLMMEGAASAAEPGAEAEEPVETSHWAYQPIRRPELPDVDDESWVRTPIDRFILARLEAEGLSPAPQADRHTLLRRARFDLLGLPPTYEETQAFLQDERADAYDRLIDRYLASPRYGERWGRHWLDVARYADTKGYVFAAEPRYAFSYTYRDYVIRAFNEDLPYDRFILEQLAADQLDRADERSLAALGFLTVGRRFRGNEHDIIDDRIDVVTRGLMGLTVACARCHDHKYDPIPTKDYYSLYGVFASSYEPDDLPLVREPKPTEEYRKYKEELDERQTALNEFLQTKHRELLGELRTHAGDYLQKVVQDDQSVDPEFGLSFDKGEPRPRVVRRWRRFLEQTGQSHHPVFAPWHELAKLPEEEFAEQAAPILARYEKVLAEDVSGPRLNRLVVEALVEHRPESMYDVARIYGRLFADVEQQWQNQDREKRSTLPDEATEELRQVLYGESSPTALSVDEAKRLFDRATRNKQRELEKKIETWKAHSPHAPPRAMVLYDKDDPVTPRVFLRGAPERKGDEVPRRFIKVLAGPDRQPFRKGSGRLELARSIVDPSNPLTARVLVNRVWMHHFGKGLVTTPGDFGVRSDPPSHPELLDWLAWKFMHDGWSIKNLHRLIMNSATYRQSNAAAGRDHARSVDPENRLLWRMNRRRKGFEAMRDSLLAVAGRLDETMGGRPVDLEERPFAQRRTIYGFVDRNNLPALFRIFDFASPDACTVQRPQTTIPQQALFGMNGEFAIEQARHLAAHPDVASQKDPEKRIVALYRRVFARDPSADEMELGLQFVESQDAEKRQAHAGDDSGKIEGEPLSAWEKYAQVLLLTNEFWFVD